MGTVAVGAVIASSGHHSPAPAVLPAAAPAANISAAAQKLPSIPPHLTADHWTVVRSGQTLSGISRDHCGTEADWTGIYEKNKKEIGNDPDLIQPGQNLDLSCVTASVPVVTVTSDVQPQYHHHHGYVQPAVASTGYSVSSGFQACVIAHESGGNPGIWNPSGHWGLYQFSAQTWAGHGGNPADFGHASAAEQTRVFWQTVHDDGTRDWAPYDGC
jgi:hypothetical protein